MAATTVTKPTVGTALDLSGIQGLVARGYGHLPAARFVLVRFGDSRRARGWLAGLLPRITPATDRGEHGALHIAFTSIGLHALGLDDATLATFSPEFQEGMRTVHRSRILGDHDDSHPDQWQWGGEHTPAVHAILMLYARDDDAVAGDCDTLLAGLTAHDVALTTELDTHPCRDFREHFGFRDGIAQPILAGLSRTGPPENTISPGEFVMGYANQYDRLPGSPTVSALTDPHGRLRPVAGEEEQHDLGRNGTYLVFRQLAQDIGAFWSFVDRMSRSAADERQLTDCVALASKMVGRWPNGAPLALAPDHEDPALAERDDFGYDKDDAHGMRCPVGAHIRRANPRDSLHPEAASSIIVSNRHRLLRRGRTYGEPVAESMEAEDILDAPSFEGDRGLHFVCLNSDIARQFEFVQQTWINNPKFEGMYNDVDAISGDHQKKNAGYFTIPGALVRRRVADVPRFVHVRGGAYFFMPGMDALHYLAELES